MSIHHDPGRTERMCALYRRNIPVETIAARFEVNRPAVYKALRRGGLIAGYTPRDVAARVPAEQEAARKASLAEHIACGASMREWSRTNGIADSEMRRLWNGIRRDLGSQAR